MRNRKGFTLIELIVTLCVLAILVGIGVGAYVGYVKKAQQKACTLNRTELMRDYNDYVELFDSKESIAEYAASSVGGLDRLCPAGGVCSYGDKDGQTYVYCSLHDADGSGTSKTADAGSDKAAADPPKVTYANWTVNTAYAKGDEIEVDGMVFECVTPHTSGTTQYTRNPNVSAGNRSRWHLVGYADGVTRGYSSIYFYEEGVEVSTKSGDIYVRNAYEPNGGSTPSASSKHWDKVD